ncbi:MAG: serine hydrolase [Bacteroidales bacterium]|nr:serine hydrolase [Bacteroidales bacterium]
MKRLAIVVAALSLAACTIPKLPVGLEHVSPAEAGMDPLALSKVDNVILQSIEDGNMPGAVLAVVRGDKIAYLRAYGNRQVVPDTVAMTTNTVFDLASVSKCVGTTLCIMKLIENGELGLEDKVSDYFPDFKPWTAPDSSEQVEITVQDLLTHASGLSPYLNVQALAERYGEPCPDSTMSYIAREVPRNFRPGTDFMYSCLNFITLQNILQKITGERLCDYAQHTIFAPLTLLHTCYLPMESKPELLPIIAPTTVQADGLPFLGVVHDPLARRLNGGNSGNAGVFSDAEDLAVIVAAIIGKGTVNGFELLKPETVELMCKVPQSNNPTIGRALGWDVWSSHSSLKGVRTNYGRTLCHTGYTGPSIVIDLDAELGIILLANRCHPKDDGSLKELRAAVSDIVAGSVIR